MGTIIAEVADALGVSEQTVGRALNRMNLADVVFELSLRFRLPMVRACEVSGVSQGELAAAATRAHVHHRREMVEQSRMVADRKVNVVRQRHGPVGEPPHPTDLWCKRSHHWVDVDEMVRNSSRTSGFGDWCKPCFRAYWAQKKAKRTAG